MFILTYCPGIEIRYILFFLMHKKSPRPSRRVI